MRAAAALLIAALAGLGGCAVLDPPQTRALTQRDADLAPRAELADVPFFAQTPYHCGPAALATVLAHLGLPANPDHLAQAVFLPTRQGSLQTEMLAGARHAGALGFRLAPELPSLLREVAAGHPVIVLQNLGLAIAPRWHYAVVVGYDLPARQVILRSGVTRREPMPLATFEHTWARAGHWAIAVLPPGRLPLTVAEAAAVEAALGFERVAPPARARLAYASVLQRWPGNPVAGMGLGNAALAGGDLQAAQTAFEAVARQHDSAAAWNNLAQVRLRLRSLGAAQVAAERAVATSRQGDGRWADAARSTLNEVRRARLKAGR